MFFKLIVPHVFGFVPAASTPANPVPSDWSSVITGVTTSFSTANIVTVIASVVAAGIGAVFLWWGMRLSFRSIMGAVKNGTLSINSGRRRRR